MNTAARVRRVLRRETIGVDVLASLNLVGALLKYLSLAFALPITVALAYGESPWPFVASAAIVAGAATGLQAATRGKERVGPREGFLVVSLIWLLAAGVAALPYWLSGEEQFAHPLDAYFEGMSGFTTTGASILTDIEALNRSLGMWRQFTQWLGGMGIVVLALAVLPRLRVGGRQLFEFEAPGPEVEPLATSIRDTARRLWLLYVALTALEVAALAFVGLVDIDPAMDFFNALAHAFSTMPSGGFSPEAESLAAFGAATHWIVIVFMGLAGANFAIMYVAIVRRRPTALVRDEELRLYVALLALGAVALFAELLARDVFAAGEEALRHSVFQSVSIMTTTGFASDDFARWTPLAAVIIVGLMFVGGSAGSTAGSVKVVRHLLIGRILRRELDQSVHPQLVEPVRLNRRAVDERTVRAVIAFVLLYVGLFAAGALAITVDSTVAQIEVSSFDAIAASAAMLGNVGPSIGIAGPFGSYEPFSDFSKVVMILLMWLGRLEIIPVAVLITRTYWRA